jgi:hypothetical protein
MSSQTFQISSLASCHGPNISERLERYLEDDEMPVPQSQFNRLRVERVEREAEARMRSILSGFDL